MAQENRTWGYDRIKGAMTNLGHKLSAATIANILKRHGIEPAPRRERKTTWKEFLSRHFDQIVATDFFTVEVWTKRGLRVARYQAGGDMRSSIWTRVTDATLDGLPA
jgi:hypothetical protein